MKTVFQNIALGFTSAAVVVALATPALAWHPVGKISKQVQNVTAGTALAEADTAAQAVEAKPGDTLKYVVTVKNNGEKHDKGHNDMHFTKVTDALPAGVTLVSGETNKDLGKIAAGESKNYEFTVKVTSEKDGDVICNVAKFTGDSEVKDQPQKGEDSACVKVKVPVKPAEPTPEPETPAPVVKDITVCELATKKTVTIKEDAYDTEKHSKNMDDCKEVEKATPAPVVETPTPGKGGSEVVELPKTGIAQTVAQTVGLGALVTAGIAYLRSRI